MAQFEKRFVQDLTQDIKIQQGGTIVFNADNLSNVVSVALYNGEEAYTGGGTVVGAVVCPDGATVALDGTLSGNVASITLTGDCFALQGQIGVSIQIVSGDVRTTVLKAIYNVDVSSTDTIVDPGSRITLSLAEIEAKLDEIPTILANAQTAIDGIEAQKDTMIASIASVAGQGTDTTLTQSGVAADAKATGDQVRALKSAFESVDNEIGIITNLDFVRGTLYRGKAVTTESFHRVCMVDYVSYPYPINISIASDYRFLLEWIDPSGTLTDENGNKCTATAFIEGAYNNIPANTQFRLAIRKATETTSVLANIAEYVAALTITSRIDYIQSFVENLESTGLKSIGSNVTGSNYTTVLPSLDDAPLNTFIPLIFSNLSTAIPTNYPYTYYNGITNILLTFARNSSGNVKTQIIITQDSIMMRYCPDGGTYTAWTTISKYTSTIKSMETNITSGNYAALMPDLDNAPSNSIYQLIFAPGSTAIPAHYPFEKYRNTVSFLITFSRNGYNNNEIRTQLLFTDNCLMMRWCVAAGTWQAWTTVSDMSVTKTQRVYTVDANGNGDYTSFVDCVKEAVKYKDSIVYVNQGDYDMAQEWGTSYLDGLTSESNDIGLMLGNGIKIIFSSNARLLFNYTGNNSFVLTEFAPINAAWGSESNLYLDYTLENMTLIASRCRYGIHDELHGTASRATHMYLNCRIELDNTNNAEWSGDCIGGGLGSNVEIIVRNCYFKCQNNWANSPAFSWHNAKVPVAQNAKSRIIIDSCYCEAPAGSKKGTFRFGYYGYSQKITEVLICGNRFTAEPFAINETQDDSPYENAELIMWNNTINAE